MVVTVPETAFGVLAGQLTYMRHMGYQVLLVSSPGPELTAAAMRERVPTHSIPMRRGIAPLHDVKALWALVRLLRALHPDITNVSTPKAGLLAGLAALIARVPVRVYTLRGLRLETARLPLRAVLWAAEWLACRAATQIIAVSPSLRQRTMDLRLAPKDKVLVIGNGSSNGVRVARFDPTPDSTEAARLLRGRLGIPPLVPVIGFVGRLNQDKGLREMAEALSEIQRIIPACHLLVLGQVDTAAPRRKGELELLHGRNVIHLGWVDDPSTAYQVMTVVALPSYREGFPNVALEAAAARLPIVTTTATGAVDAVVDGVTGLLVPPRDARALANALIYLLQHPNEARRMGDAAYERAVTCYEPERIWRGLAEVYDDSLARTVRRRQKETSSR